MTKEVLTQIVTNGLIVFLFSMLMYYIRRGDKEIEKKVEKLTEVVEFMKDEINKLKSDVSLLFYSARSVEKLKEVVDEVRNKVARIEGKLER